MKIIKLESSKAVALLLLLLFITCDNMFAQRAVLEIYPTLGITRRSLARSSRNLDVAPSYYYHSKTMGGLSISPGVQIYKDKIGVEYVPNFRTAYQVDILSVEDRPSLVVDHNINLLVKRKQYIYGVGISVINPGEEFHVRYSNPERYIDIEYMSYNLLINMPIWKQLHASLKLLYVPYNLPDNRTEKYLMYSVRLFYKFDFVNKLIVKRRAHSKNGKLEHSYE